MIGRHTDRKYRIAIAAACASLALIAAPAAGQGRRYGKAFIERFSLNEAQVAKLEQIRSAREAGREQERVLRHQINGIVSSSEYDEAEVARIADQLAALIRSNVLAQSAQVHEFYLSLNEQQRALWVSHETRTEQQRQPGHKKAHKADTPSRPPAP